MPNDERILETIPSGILGLVPTKSCTELGAKVDKYLTTWRENREHQHKHDAAFKDYHKDSYVISVSNPRFGSGEAKCVINQSIRDSNSYSSRIFFCRFSSEISASDKNDTKRLIDVSGVRIWCEISAIESARYFLSAKS